MKDNRLIEETFPIREVSEESAREKSIRHGHISTLHIWWARRPLASSRATAYASLITAPTTHEELEKRRQFIIKLSKWTNSLDRTLLEKAKRDILDANGGKPPKVLDPFSGGGALPLESLRLGCDTYANDYNPVSNLILKCTVEYPQKYGSNNNTSSGLADRGTNRLLVDVKKWGELVLDDTKKEIAQFYLQEKDGFVPVGYLWTRTIPCQNPSCNAEIPLLRQYWLVNKDNKKISLYPRVSNKRVTFKIVGDGYGSIPKDFDPKKGTISKAVATCIVCGSIVDDKSTRRLFREGKSQQKMQVVVLHKEGSGGKKYRIATGEDMKIFNETTVYLEKKREVLMNELGMDPVPDEPISTPNNAEYETGSVLYNFTPVVLYGMTKFRDLFNSRQKLALITFGQNVRNAYKKMIERGYDEDYAKAVVTYLALIIDRQIDYNSTLCLWHVNGEFIAHTFGRQALPMIWDYFELMPWSGATGDWNSALDWVLRVIEHTSNTSALSATVSQSSATQLPYPDNYFDAVFTDPPYYDNVPYANLSDFFYVWLKRIIGELYPDLFSTPLTPKSSEAIAELPLLRGMDKEKAVEVVKGIKTSTHFENMLLQSFSEIRRTLKPNGVCIIVYAHKSASGWETLVNSILDSGLLVTGAWPINTEMKARLRAKESAALASSIYMVVRKIQKESIGFYRNVRDDLRTHLNKKLDRLWKEGISGADFFISAIGSSIEVFGKYEKIIDDEENLIRADKLLEEVRRIVVDYAVRQVLHNGFASEISQLTRFYVLWRWAYGESSVLFDDARKMAQSVGINLSDEWNRGFVYKDKEFILVLGPDDRKLEELNDSKELIDVLHKVLLLWKKGKNDEIVNVLKDSGFGKSDVFYRVAQAISESLPNESKEKKLLEGFLAGKERMSKDVRKDSGQRRLLE